VDIFMYSRGLIMHGKRKILCISLLGFLPVFCMVMLGCPEDGGEASDIPPPSPPVRVFSVTHDPASRSYAPGGVIRPLTVELLEPGAYEYQWYRNAAFSPPVDSNITLPPLNDAGWTPVQGATKNTYTPADSGAGDYYYYVQVKKSNQTVNSRPALIRISDEQPSAGTVFAINDTKYNYVRGIGGTGAFMFRQEADATPDATVEYIDKFMGDDGVGSNILRIMVQDDYENYITGTIQGRNRDMHPHDPANNYFAVIKRVNQYGGYVLASPWTAPASMKLNNSLYGGTNSGLRTQAAMRTNYANHLRGYLNWLNDNGAPIYAISLLHEPDYAESAAYEAMSLSATLTRSFWTAVGHFTTWRVESAEEDIIPGFGGGKPTHHVLTMNGESRGAGSTAVSDYNDPVINDAEANLYVELFGVHKNDTSSAGRRYDKLVGPTDTATRLGPAWADRPDLGFTSDTPELFVQGKREIWMTEHGFHGDDPSVPDTTLNTWAQVFPVMNSVDDSLRIKDESAFIYWNSQASSGMVSSIAEGGWKRGDITLRGRAYAHYARFVKETWRLGLTRTLPTSGFSFNPYLPTNFVNFSVKGSAYLDAHAGKFISVVLFTPSNASGENAVNVGPVRIDLPEGFTARTAYALKSFGGGEGEYWLDELVILSADGKSAFITLPASTVISIKFMLEG
jgi:O-glycosyl hydrolase